jgi:hypothetical protein
MIQFDTQCNGQNLVIMLWPESPGGLLDHVADCPGIVVARDANQQVGRADLRPTPAGLLMWRSPINYSYIFLDLYNIYFINPPLV